VTGAVVGSVPAARIPASRRSITSEGEARALRGLADASPGVTVTEIAADGGRHEIAAAGTA
jgi:hypothetical protein